MRKAALFLLLLFSPSVYNSCYADVIPYYTYSIKHTGIGVLKVPEKFNIYEKPNEKSKILKRADIKTNHSNMVQMGANADKDCSDLLVVQVEASGLAYVAVDDEQGEWFQIYYSQNENKLGWVKSTQENFWTWKEFYNCWGRKNGVYLFKDVNKEQQKLYAQAEDEAKPVEGFLYPIHVYMTVVKGNWMLVKVVDVGNKEKIGYIRWRDLEGKFFIFPIIK